MKLLKTLMAVLFLQSCASTHPGKMVRNLKTDDKIKMNVSSIVIGDYSDKRNYYMDITFENKSDEWVRIDETELDFTNTMNSPHQVIVGRDLYAWGESFREKEKISKQNHTAGVFAMIMAGAVLAAAGASNSNSGAYTAGASMMYGAAAWDATGNIVDMRNKNERSKSVPDTHIYRPFTVPPNGLIRRWVLINIPKEYVSKEFFLTLKTVEGYKLEYAVPLADAEWQMRTLL